MRMSLITMMMFRIGLRSITSFIDNYNKSVLVIGSFHQVGASFVIGVSCYVG